MLPGAKVTIRSIQVVVESKTHESSILVWPAGHVHLPSLLQMKGETHPQSVTGVEQSLPVQPGSHMQNDPTVFLTEVTQ